MNLTQSFPLLVEIGVALIAGFAVGLLYFEALRRTVMQFAAQDGRLGRVAMTVGRMGLAVAVFVAAARMGAASLLATFVGFLLARTVALHRVQRDA